MILVWKKEAKQKAVLEYQCRSLATFQNSKLIFFPQKKKVFFKPLNKENNADLTF